MSRDADAGPLIDAEGRLLDPNKQWEIDNAEVIPEDPDLFVSLWQIQRVTSTLDWALGSKIAWPLEDRVVICKRFDLYYNSNPISQLGTSNPKESAKYRKLQGWVPVRSILFLDEPSEYTMELVIESCAPPRRNRFRPAKEKNTRDLSDWTEIERLIALQGSQGTPGVIEFFVSWSDSPDRYQITSDFTADAGWRRLFRFSAYPLTQYYILEKRVYHSLLEAEGGSGVTYNIEKGPQVFCKKDWRLQGSFYAFDLPIPGSNEYTIYYRSDPFPRVLLCIGEIDHAEEWTIKGVFYAFDVPIPNSCCYTVQHCIRSIHSVAASISRHRITTEEALMPWEFRQNIYVLPASLDECSLVMWPV